MAIELTNLIGEHELIYQLPNDCDFNLERLSPVERNTPTSKHSFRKKSGECEEKCTKRVQSIITYFKKKRERDIAVTSNQIQ